MLQGEKEKREAQQIALQKSLEQMEYSLLLEVAKEKSDRENTEENILKMIEQTCSRIESGNIHLGL